MKEPIVFEAHASYVLGLGFAPDKQALISAGMDNVVKVWSVPDWELVKTLEGHANSVNSISLSPDGKTLATGSTDNTVKLWSLADGEVLHTLQDRKKVVAAVQISPDGQWVVAGSYGGRAVVWTLGGEQVAGIKASKKNLSSVAVSPHGKTLATAGLGDEIALWALPAGEPMGTLSGHQTAVGSLTFVGDGRYLVSLGYEQAVKFWDTGTWQETRTLRSTAPGVRGIVFSPDEETAALSLEGKVQLWSVDDWALQAELPIGTKVVSAMAFSGDGQWLAIGAADRKIRIWDLQ
jgi:WD40 repeat protein